MLCCFKDKTKHNHKTHKPNTQYVSSARYSNSTVPKTAMAPPKKYYYNHAEIANASSNRHPPYFQFQMISEAITSLKDRHGSSQPAIAKFVERKYRELLPPNFKKLLSIQLKKFVKSEKLTKVKNSYKISAPEKVVVKSARKIQPEATATRRAAAKKSNARGHGPSTNKRRANEKALKKMKRLSQVETPEALEKNSRGLVTTVKGSITGAKMKRLRQVKTPETLKKKNAASIPAKKIKLLPTPCLQNHQTLLGPIAKKTRK